VAVASAGPNASLHFAPHRQPRQHPTTHFSQAADAVSSAQRYKEVHACIQNFNFEGAPNISSFFFFSVFPFFYLQSCFRISFFLSFFSHFHLTFFKIQLGSPGRAVNSWVELGRKTHFDKKNDAYGNNMSTDFCDIYNYVTGSCEIWSSVAHFQMRHVAAYRGGGGRWVIKLYL